MTFVQVLYFIDEQIREIDFLILGNSRPDVLQTLNTSKKALTLLKRLLIEKANKEQEEIA